MEAHDFRVYFTPLAGVLFTVPSRYCALSVTACSLPWTVVSPASNQVLRAWPYSGAATSVGGERLRDYHALWCGFPDRFAYSGRTDWVPPETRVRPTTPPDQGLAPWQSDGLGSTRFVRHYYGCGSLFLRLLRCFSWPGALRTRGAVTTEVVELPHSEISGSGPASGSPEHIGAVPRPSSARSARASIVCS